MKVTPGTATSRETTNDVEYAAGLVCLQCGDNFVTSEGRLHHPLYACLAVFLAYYSQMYTCVRMIILASYARG